jgi:formylglycine-generating enzyme required for sulfatase activity
MATARWGRVVVFDARLYQPGGLVWEWTHDVGTLFSANARRFAPIRSGQLRRGIRAGFRKAGTKRVQATIGSTAPHTVYVLRGTTGPIVSSRPGGKLAVGRNPFAPETYRAVVSGQRANNFFAPAWAATAAVHPAIGRFPGDVLG